MRQTLPQVILIALKVQRLRVDGGKNLIKQAAIRSRQLCLGTQKRRWQRGGKVPPHRRRHSVRLSEDRREMVL
jgi:Ni/Co efflux regulator RcnB